jgi:hypothetical protein
MNLRIKSVALKSAAVLSAIALFANCGPNNENAQQDIGADDPVVTEGSKSAKTFGYRVMINDDPSTTATIGYSTTESEAIPNPGSHIPDKELIKVDTTVYVDTTDKGLAFDKYAGVYKPTRVVEHKGMYNYFLSLKALKPSTKYYFIVVDGKKGKEGVSRRLWFKTAADSNTTRLSIISGGDTRTNRKPRQEGMKIVAKLRPDFVMFQGDHTTLNSTWEWERWLNDWQLTIAQDGRVTPAIFTRGNHESSNKDLENIFNTPSGVYYAVTFGRDLLRIYTLNSESAVSGDQAKWLGNDLSENSNVRWKFAQYHSPIRPHTAGKKDETVMYQTWAPLFYSGRMNVVAEADAHTVKVTWPVRPSTSGDDGFARDDANGTVFIGEGTWGAPLRANDNLKSWTRDSGRFNSFFWIFVDKEKTELRSIVIGNPDAVASVLDTDRFAPPAGLNVWKAPNGSVVSLKAR